MKLRITSGIFAISAVISAAAHADATLNTSTTTTVPSFYERVSEKVMLNYFGTYRGSSLSHLGDSLTPDAKGIPDKDTPQHIESVVTAGFRVNKDLMVGIMAHFYNYPGAAKPSSNSAGFQMYDPAIAVFQSNLINNGPFKLNGRLITYIPLTSVDILQREHQAVAISPTFIATYDVPRTPLTIGIWSYLRAYIPTADAVANARTYKIYIAPNLNYQLTRTLAATLWVDLVQAARTKGTGFFSGIDNAAVDIEPGISWDVTKNITINPLINIYPGSLTLAATSIQANIIARAF